MGPGTLLRIPFGLAELPAWLWRRPEETGDPGCTVPGAEESEEDLAGLPELLWIVPEPTPAEERAEIGASATAPGAPVRPARRRRDLIRTGRRDRITLDRICKDRSEARRSGDGQGPASKHDG